jgi:CheY-like chemotaxis protein
MPFVLLLEDEDIQIKIVTDLLKYQLNLPVKAAKSLDEALELVKENPVLIISDIVLVRPDSYTSEFNKDGLKFIKAIKENPETSHIPAILRTTMPIADIGHN